MSFFAQDDTRIASRNTRFSNPRVAGSSPAAPTSPTNALTNQLVSGSFKLQPADFRGKRPSASVAALYQKAALVNQFRKVETLPPTKEHWDEYERLRDLAKRLRKAAGFSPWWPVGFAALWALLVIVCARRQTIRDFTFSAPADKFQVLRRYDAFRYQFNHVGHGPLAVTFCPNYEPQLSAGQTIVWIHYQDLGRCWDILPEGYGYRLERGSDGKPTLAPNCIVNKFDVTECAPNKTEARF